MKSIKKVFNLEEDLTSDEFIENKQDMISEKCQLKYPDFLCKITTFCKKDKKFVEHTTEESRTFLGAGARLLSHKPIAEQLLMSLDNDMVNTWAIDIAADTDTPDYVTALEIAQKAADDMFVSDPSRLPIVTVTDWRWGNPEVVIVPTAFGETDDDNKLVPPSQPVPPIVIAPTYTFSLSKSELDEGETLSVTLTTTSINPISSIPYTVTGIDADDLLSGSLTGTFDTDGNVGTVSFTFKEDVKTEGLETFKISLDGKETHAFASINDTSFYDPTGDKTKTNVIKYNQGDITTETVIQLGETLITPAEFEFTMEVTIDYHITDERTNIVEVNDKVDFGIREASPGIETESGWFHSNNVKIPEKERVTLKYIRNNGRYIALTNGTEIFNDSYRTVHGVGEEVDHFTIRGSSRIVVHSFSFDTLTA